ADTVVYRDKILGKPKDIEDAKRILKSLSGQDHQVYTGITVIDNESDKILTEYYVTTVTMVEMTDDEIYSYISTGEPMDKAGAYAIQGIASKYIKSINGCFFNVVGLPIAQLRLLLREVDVYF
ncbi:MAG TPA: Maf family protein, partial [Clostridia bacterium]|nr:Maf family protein [Clostridia bacterium]